ncbi:MAG: hypothetical protein EHM42_05165 [Planctomycetaceae bacterium]|nr:MAG: hypothetical protein EHM42_05165 [Planctomycetaceae bacterium]
MQNFLAGYQLSDPTWLYLSFLLILAVYFKFSRIWLLRNLDLLLLLAISPGVLIVRSLDENVVERGYMWQFMVSGLLLVRILMDGLWVRRPRLEQNMNAAGMSFLCAATVVFLTVKLLTDPIQQARVVSIAAGGEKVADTSAADVVSQSPGLGVVSDQAVPTVPLDPQAVGPTTELVSHAVGGISKVVTAGNPQDTQEPQRILLYTVRIIAILSHLAVIVGLTLVGRQTFGDPDLGFAMSALYMILPCTAFELGAVNQVLPAALVVWAVYFYRYPIASGSLLGLASGIVFFPVFLLPLWGAFYGKRGGGRFVFAVMLTTILIVQAVAFLTQSAPEAVKNALGYFQWNSLEWQATSPKSGFWTQERVVYRIPVVVSYLLMLVALTIWPRRKSLAQLIPHSAAIVVGSQFWYPPHGGIYVVSYLPLVLMVMFRPMISNHFAPEIPPIALFRRFRRTAALKSPDLVEASRV